MIPAGEWVCAVDFGTTNTVAAVGDATGVRPLNINGRTIMPSAVVLQGHRLGRQQWLVGEHAINAARARLGSFERKPKSRIPDGTVLLGGRQVPVVDVVAAVLRHVVEEAQRQRGPRAPARFVVTHPADWAGGRIGVLLQAAHKATEGFSGWPEPEPLPEPVAAAHGVLGIDELPSPARIAVLDLGGGTVDVAIVDRDGPELRVVGIPQGTDQVGGEEFDLRLARLMMEEVESPRRYDELVISDDVEDRELAMDIRTEAQLVKEQLSVDTPVAASVPIPPRGTGGRRSVQVSRERLEELIKGGDGERPGLVDAVRLVTAARAALPSSHLPFHVYLVGGSSRIPMLGRLVQEETETTPISHGDPSTAVAEGAADWARTVPPVGGWGDGAVPQPLPRPPWWRRLLRRIRELPVPVRAMITALVVGLVSWALLVEPPTDPQPSSCPPPTTNGPNGTCVQTEVAPLPHITQPGVGDCKKFNDSGCETAINAASRNLWPGIPSWDCKANDSQYGVDLYSFECKTDTLSYSVFWRNATGSIIPFLAQEMIKPSVNEFRVGDDPKKLGTQLGGTRRTKTGDRFTCVFEYTDFKVTMLLDGPNEDSTVTRCQTQAFLDSAGMESAMPKR